jgi:uncharacterized repeat protein (TIGR01451 family)
MTKHRTLGMSSAIVVVAIALAATGLGGSTAWAATPTPTTKPSTAPQLSISISDKRQSTARGDSLTYSIVVSNLGVKDAHALAITQNIPDGMTFGSATKAGTVKSAKVTWATDIRASRKVTFSTTMKVTTAPADELRLATVACALTSPTAAPVVCASDSDRLPIAAAAATRTPQPAGLPVVWWLVGAAVVLVLIIATLGFVLIPRRRMVRSHDSAS